jgi:hypothetical protein
MQEGEHREVMLAAVAAEAEGHRALLEGEHAASREAYARAARDYARSWALAPPASYGRLVGWMTAAGRAGAAGGAAREVRGTLAGEDAAGTSPVAAYAGAVAALVTGDDEGARAAAQVMRGGSPAFGRAADGIEAIAGLDEAGVRRALAAIEEDIAAREEHLSGVPNADTAVMLAALAEGRGLGEADAGGPLRPAWTPA